MGKLLDNMRGYCTIKIKGCEPEKFLNILAGYRLEFWDAKKIDEYTIILNTRFSDRNKLTELAKTLNLEVEIIKAAGLPKELKKIKGRYVFAILPVILLILLTASAFFVWKIEIIGNEEVSQTEIINALASCGVKVGAYHPAFSNDMIRNQLLTEIPKLKWASVRVYGSRVNVQVRERTEIPKDFDKNEAVKIVAKHSGVIETISVKSGTPLKQKNYTAAKGDVLVEGTVKGLDGSVSLVHADAEIRARTYREINCIMPVKYKEKRYNDKNYVSYGILIGSKAINFSKSSRIFDANCDNIIEEKKLSIPGLFEMPISIIKTQSLGFELEACQYEDDEAESILKSALKKALEDEIGENGSIEKESFSIVKSGEFYVAALRAECIEELALEQKLTEEEIIAARTAGKEKSKE